MKTSLHILQLALLVCFVATAGAQPSDIRQGLVAYWPLDVNNGGTTPDMAFANTMSVAGGPVVGAGQVGNAFTFNGSSTYLLNVHGSDNAATGLPIYRAGSYTIAMWVKGAAQTAKYLFTEGNNSGANQNVLLVLQTGQVVANNAKLDVIIRNDTGGVANTPVDHRVSTSIVFDNTWHHIAWVDDRGSARLYVDGNLDPANFNYTPIGTYSFTTTAIGALVRSATAGFFNGQLDDIAVWERPLSQAEVQQVRNSSLVTPIPPLPPDFVTQPVGGTRGLGDRITLQCRAVGTRPLNLLGYQWFKGGVEIPGATADSLTLANLTPADSGDFTVRVTNAVGGSVTSGIATLTVLPDPASNVPQGLVSHWAFDALGGMEPNLFAPDTYSANHMKLIYSGFIDQASGAFGQAMVFNGTDQYAVRESGFPIYNNPAFSVAFWVAAATPGQIDKRVFAESSTNNANPVFSLGTSTNGANSKMRVLIRNDAGAVVLDRSSTRDVLDGTIRHVVWTEANGQGKLYIDGELDETDFTYAHAALAINQTTFGALLRSSASNFFGGQLDDAAVWTRVLTFTEIQDIRMNGIVDPIAPIPPAITSQPVSQSVMTLANVTFAYAATGTSPLDAQWRKDGLPLAGETNVTLHLSGVSLGDAGNYTVVVTNSAGGTTSEVATLTVTLRPSPPASLKVDFNNTGQDAPTDTESGFSSFALPAVGPGPVTRVFGGTEVTLTGVGVNLESRKRATPVNNGAFNQERLLQDFLFVRDTVATPGLDVAVEFMESNRVYTVTIWSFDTGNTGNRISDWSANGLGGTNGYTFNGSVLPTSNDSYRFSFETTSDASGKILIQARRAASATATINVFLNALEITRREIRVLDIDTDSFGDIVLTFDAIHPGATHRVDQKTSLDQIWTPAVDVIFSAPVGHILTATIPSSADPTRFFRVVEVP